MTDVARLRTSLADRYRLDRELGRGGMATVYLAEDIKHGRRVALKVLHPELAAVLGAERFLAEIKTTAHLQHPNILQLFDSGSADGLLYYVMPFVEGESLRARLDRERQLPVDDAIAIARGAAAALDYAHRQGVIHRDIKPENILLQDGQPLVADFGIALAVQHAGGARITQTGLSLGTPQYMSPEQATAERDLDARSDVYALGAVTYEMLGGEPPYTGSSTQAIIAKLLTEEPRHLRALRKTVPEHIEAAVHRALEKLPADRFASAAQFSEALQGGARSIPLRGQRATATASRRPTSRLVVAAIALAALTIGILAGRGLRGAPAPLVGSRLALLNETTDQLAVAGLSRVIALSEDGMTLAYFVRSPAGRSTIRVHRLDGSQAVSTVQHSGNLDYGLFVSPDGRHIYVDGATGELERIPAGGGGGVPVRGVSDVQYLAWGPDGTMWVTSSRNVGDHGIARVTPDGKRELLHRRDSLGRTPTIQQVLPGGRRALVVLSPNSGNSGDAIVLDLETGTRTPVLEQQVTEMRYSSGYLIYVLPAGTLNAILFDAERGIVSGDPIELANDVSLSGSGVAQFAVSGNGSIVYMPTQERSLVLVDRAGTARALTPRMANYHGPRVSADGSRIAVDLNSQDGRDVWVLDRGQGTLSRATYDRDGHDPTWTPGGQITYSSAKSGTVGVYRATLGVARAESLFASNKLGFTGVWTPDGKSFVTAAVNFDSTSAVDVVRVTPGATPVFQRLVVTKFTEGWAEVSRDGKWLAYASDQTGRLEIYVQRLDGTGSAVQVSLDGGTEPVWARSGRELFYRHPRGGAIDFVVATLQVGADVRVVDRKTLFDGTEYDATQPHVNYDVMPGDNGFVMVRRSPASHIVIIQNVADLIRARRGAAAR